MSFGGGKATKVIANGWDVSGYFNSAQPQRQQGAYDVTTFGNSAKRFIPGIRDGSINLEGFFDGADDAIDEVLQAALGGITGVASVFPQGDAIGARGFACAAIETNYQITDPVDGAVAISAAVQADAGLDGVVSLHALGAETGVANGASVDNGASSANGGVGYIQATAFIGTSVTVKVQHSTDDLVWVDLITFAAIDAAHDTERATVSGTVNRYLRARHDSGTFTSVTDQVAFGRFNS